MTMGRAQARPNWARLLFHRGSVILGPIIGLLGLYAAFFYEKVPDLQLDVVSNAAVLDVQENVPKLGILYDGVEIRERNESLRVLSVEIRNTGRREILPASYETGEPAGFRLTTGRLLQTPETIAASTGYLRKHGRPTVVDSQTVVLPPVVLEPGEFFILKLLALVPEGNVPSVRPGGKVAGVRSIGVSESYRQAEEVSVLTRVFGGDLLVQTARLVAYTMSSIGIVLSVVGIGSLASTRWRRLRRRRLIKLFLRESQSPHHVHDEAILDVYRRGGFEALSVVSLVLEEDEGLRILDADFATASLGVPVAVYDALTFDVAQLIRELRDRGVIQRVGEEYVVADGVRERLRELREYLETRSQAVGWVQPISFRVGEEWVVLGTLPQPPGGPPARGGRAHDEVGIGSR